MYIDQDADKKNINMYIKPKELVGILFIVSTFKYSYLYFIHTVYMKLIQGGYTFLDTF